jgi:hypothetical protein
MVSKSVDVLVAEAATRVRKRLQDRNVGGIQPLALQTAADQQEFALALLADAGFPALVEALAHVLGGCLNADDLNDARDDFIAACQDALGVAGGVRVSGGAELEAENERLREALRGYVDAAPHDAGGEMRRIEVERRVIRTARDLVYPPFGSAVDGETTTTKGSE